MKGQWIRIASLEECPPGTAREFVAADKVIGLFNVDGELSALDGICPHQGGPLARGVLDGEWVTCPWHGWQFHVRSGQHAVNPSLKHTRFPVRVDGPQVYVWLETED
jgi:nitrite reductase (NADH) small subunit